MSDKEQRIRARAYEIYEQEGRHDGRAEEHWQQAKREIEHALASAQHDLGGSRAQPRHLSQPLDGVAKGRKGGLDARIECRHRLLQLLDGLRSTCALASTSGCAGLYLLRRLWIAMRSSKRRIRSRPMRPDNRRIILVLALKR